MHFTRLRLNGFKSFVDPTDLVIAAGLTGVVGPNGCGKSNLLEALRWVMGENRASAMRGDGMEDVIFAGAASRPARHFAEVTLTIDNAERLAPAGFNDADMLEIVRRITRDAGSAYKVNGKDVRARDVQMLFADAATGAQSPALVRQGQISELINARPKNRRRVLEDAAGIGGLYQRRHEAELRLRAAEANLTRVDDLIEALAQQLAALGRQARQAARYREISDALRAAEAGLLWRRWQEADAARVTAAAHLRDRLAAAAGAERQARDAAASREAAEVALPPLREEDAIAAALVQRLTVEQATVGADLKRAEGRIAALRGQLAQLDADARHEEQLTADAAETIARLTAEAAELDAAGSGEPERIADAEARAQDAARVLAAREAELTDATDAAARLSARHQAVERLRQDTIRTATAAQEAAARAEGEVTTLTATADRAAAALAAAAQALDQAQGQADQAETALKVADDAREDAQTREAEVRATRSVAEGEMQALKAESQALVRLLDRDTREGGQVLDLIRVDPGFERALGAALAEDLRAPLAGSGQRTGWVELDVSGTAPALPDGVRPLTDVTLAPHVLARRIAQVGLVDAADGARVQAQLAQGQRLVSVEGDLWRWDGYRVAAADAPSAAALRLAQLNRLEVLKRDLEEAVARATGAAQAHDHLRARLAQATAADAAAREARRMADRALAEAARALSKAEGDQALAQARLEAARQSRARMADEAAAAAVRLVEANAAQADLPDLSAGRALVDDLRVTVEAARLTLIAARSALSEARQTAEARIQRSQTVARDLAQWRTRADTADRRMADLDARRAKAAADLKDALAAPDVLRDRAARVAQGLSDAQARQAAARDALSAAEGALRAAAATERDAERAAGEAREARARADAQAEAAAEAVAQALSRLHEAGFDDPAALLAALATDPQAIPGADALDAEIARLRRAREALGAVNLRAEEDAKDVETEHATLVAEKADLEAAIARLRSGIAGLNREGRERLLTAFEQVNANFTTLFRHLFGGGEARLQLVESDDPLEAGLEILCQPPGKKLSTLSLLSGGEQTLTALALIFGVFLTNPAPVCVLDEVDAPLDDANVTRFCDLLDEMTRQTATRFLVITHHSVTMSRMDRLFGVTMGEAGVSQLVSVDLKRAESLVA
ncbi:MAG: AAA family ATPase [Rhodobacteraceae bacterium]|nr:AAA family ATPase [Paracoccaceae bacterium]